MLRSGWLAADFSLSSLYGRDLRTACPVASSSRVELVIPANSKNRFSIEPKNLMEVVHADGQEIATWDTRTGE